MSIYTSGTQKTRKILWIVISTVLTIAFILEKDIPQDRYTLSYIQKTGAYPYAVLTMCILMLYLKKDRITADIQKKTSIFQSIIGISLTGLSMLLPANEPRFMLFNLLLLWLGIFTAVFGKPPSILFALPGIYGFSLLFPPLIAGLGNLYPLISTIILVTLLTPFVSISNQGQSIHFLDAAGGSQTYFIDSACSGSASLAIFFSIFFLMVLDAPLSWRKTGHMLIFGIAGTSFQNILRLAVLVFTGYWYGSDAVWVAHTYAGYVLFPAWYLLFAYVYLKHARENRSPLKIL